jgi:hypothetical protein
MKVRNGQNGLQPCSQPSLLIQSLAFRAMAIAAGVVGLSLVATVKTRVIVSAQNSGSAGLDGPHHFELLAGQRITGAIGGTVRPKDLGDLEARSICGWPGAPGIAHRELPEHLALLGPQQIKWTLGTRNGPCAHVSVDLRRGD